MSEVENNLNSQASKGYEAKILLDNSLLAEFFKETENALITGIKVSRPDEYEQRENYCKMLKTLDSFKQMLVHYVEGGKMAEQMLADLKRGALDI